MVTIDLNPNAPHSTKRTLAVADAAAEAIRTLNYATMHGRMGLEYPGDVYELLGTLAQIGERLPQLCDQLRTWLMGELNAGRLGEPKSGPNGGSATLAVLRARDQLALAAGNATELRAQLRQAQASISAVQATDGVNYQAADEPLGEIDT